MVGDMVGDMVGAVDTVARRRSTRQAEGYARCQDMSQSRQPPSSGPGRADLRQQLTGLAERANDEAQRSRVVASRWSTTHLALGLPTAVLAAVAGATGLASAAGRIPAAILALAAAGLSAASTFLKGDSRAADTWKRAAAWSTLSADARLVAAYEGNRARSAEIRNQLAQLLARQDAIMNDDLETARRLRAEGVGRVVEPDDHSPYYSDEQPPSSPGGYLKM
jgi:hypothetical protein